MMLRKCPRVISKNYMCILNTHKKYFLTNTYKCSEIWSSSQSGPIFEKINLQDFYNVIDQNYSSKGLISAIDVDIFANAIKDSTRLEELKDLLHKLRLSAETNNMLESTAHATIRKFLEFGEVIDLVEILKDPLNFGVFLDDYSANMLLDRLITSSNFELAARVASLVMLQEECNNQITSTLCQYACFKYIEGYTQPEPAPQEDKKIKVEEIKIRVKFLRNPYFDDHFDLKETILLSGKTLAWLSEQNSENVSNNLQIIGWLAYKKYSKLLELIETISKQKSFKLYPEIIRILQREQSYAEEDSKAMLDKCLSIINTVEQTDGSLEESLKVAVENAINKSQKNDITAQEMLFQSWAKTREVKLSEQTKRLDRARRIQLLEQKQNEMTSEEQRLWFFENEDKIDLEIEEKEKLEDKSVSKKKDSKADTEEYIPPEIRPKRR